MEAPWWSESFIPTCKKDCKIIIEGCGPECQSRLMRDLITYEVKLKENVFVELLRKIVGSLYKK